MIIPVLLTGGSGTRLWPLSRKRHPKQFLQLAGDCSLLEDTARRMAALPDCGAVLAVAGEDHRFVVAEHLRRSGAGETQILLEPAARNTAPAVALAALQAKAEWGGDTILFVCPSDHVVPDQAAFAAAAEKAVAAARDGALVTFGVVPARPETGYGYLKAGAILPGGGRELVCFVEKPDAATARSYVESGEYFWNSGMFVFQAQAFLDELQSHAPAIFTACCEAIANSSRDSEFVRADAQSFAACPSDSIDYAVMEKTNRGVVVPLDCGWNDVGSWTYLAETRSVDARGNVSDGDVRLRNSDNCTVYSGNRLVAAVGLRDTVIVETKDAVLVAGADQLQEIKGLVAELEADGRSEVHQHPRVYRPWGSYESVDSGERFQVKRIVVAPGKKLSLQMHHHRAEHWTVVKGTARVTRGEDSFLLSEDESTYIPVGTKHRLENPGAIPLELIEVQTGSYLGEDDIVRFADDFGRQGSSAE